MRRVSGILGPVLGGAVSDEPDVARAKPFFLIFAGIWLVYLADPIAAAWQIRTTTKGVIGLVATVAFAAVYLWHFAMSRRYAWSADEESGRATAGMRGVQYSLLAGLALVTTLTIGQSGTATWVFLAVAGLWTFPAAVAIIVAAVLATAYEVVVHKVPGWERDNGVSLSIVLAVLAVGGGMLASRRSRDLGAARRENARLAVEEERNRMARDVHDILGHSLTVITVKAELAGRLIEVSPERAKAEIESLESLAREALADVRGAVEGFREISLAGELARAREALAAAGIEADLPRAIEGVPPAVRELYAWTVREGVTNVIRHSGASRCVIRLTGSGLSVRDDGPGEPDGTRGGNGLRGLRERAGAVGALLQTRQLAPGFEVSVLVPELAESGRAAQQPSTSSPPSAAAVVRS